MKQQIQLAALAVPFLFCLTAHADHHETGDVASVEPADWEAGTEEVEHHTAAAHHNSLMVAPGNIALNGVLEINLSSDNIGEPISLAPNVWYGVSNELTIGLVHNSSGSTGFLGGVGEGICFTGDTSGCGSIYTTVGVAGRYLISHGATSFAVDGGLFHGAGGSRGDLFDPLLLQLKAGVAIRHSINQQMSIDFMPNIFIGITERDFNQEALNLPVTLNYMATPELALTAQTGLASSLENFGDRLRVPLSVGAMYHVSPTLAVGGVFTLPAVVGGDLVADGFDNRTLWAVVDFNIAK